MSSLFAKRQAEHQSTEDTVLEYLKGRNGQPVITAAASKNLKMTHERFRSGITRLMSYGAIERTGGSSAGGWVFTVRENEPPRYGRVNCPRCETVGCTKHTATRLTAGYVGQVIGGWR